MSWRTRPSEWQVGPTLAVQNVPEILLRCAVFLGQLSLANAACFIAVARLNNLRVGKPCHAAAFAARISTLTLGVCRILCVRSEEQMVGADTAAISGVTDRIEPIAVVANLHVVRDRAMSELVREAMGKYLFIADADSSVSLFNERSGPQPTAVSLLNLLPKSLLKRSGFADVSKRTTPSVVADPTAKVRWLSPLRECALGAAGRLLKGFAAPFAAADFGAKIRTHFGTSLQVSRCHEVGRPHRRDLILFA
jgi:hypothetical protein